MLPRDCRALRPLLPERLVQLHDEVEALRHDEGTVLRLKEALLRLYDPKRMAPKFHPLYTLRNLAKRESLKFDQRVRTVLHKIWLLYDQDHGRPSARPLLVSFCASLR